MGKLHLSEADLTRVHAGVLDVSSGITRRVEPELTSGGTWKCNIYKVGNNVVRLDFINQNKETH